LLMGAQELVNGMLGPCPFFCVNNRSEDPVQWELSRKKEYDLL